MIYTGNYMARDAVDTFTPYDGNHQPPVKTGVLQRAKPLEMGFPCYRCGAVRVATTYTMCKNCMDSITGIKKEDVEKALQSVSRRANTPKEAVSTIKPENEHHNAGKSLHHNAGKLDEVADILVDMNIAFSSPSYCQNLNKYNIRGEYRMWAKRIVDVCEGNI